MSKRESLSRYSLIIKKLKRCPATFDEIANTLALESELQEYNFMVSKRTFQRDLDEILALYNIEIRYNFSRRVYEIVDDDMPEIRERILEAFDVFNALNLSDRLSQHIHFEQRRPRGTENLYGLLHAIKNGHRIRFVYVKFWDESPTVRTAEPYALREFRNRWYVMANDLKDDRIKSFALDRLSDLEILKTKFTIKPGFDVIEHFRYCFGIISPNADKPEEVILSFTPVQGKYIRSLPLHETQQVLADTQKELRIGLKLFITHDLVMEILSHGSEVKVLAPESLVKQVREAHRKAAMRQANT
jgi:predicted DNA-binding transcriptional regulator YafY